VTQFGVAVTEEGVDYAFTVVNEEELHAAGKRFAGRYGGPGTADKHLTAAERDRLFAAGLDIMCLAEGAAGDALQGRALGVAHGQSAAAMFHALGAPDSAAIYAAVDFDCTASQWPAVANYLRGFGAGLGSPARVGVYGGLRVMQWAARDRVASYFFQTYAWSGGAWFAGNHVEQYRNGVALAGGEVDLCRSKVANFGQWSRTPPPPNPPNGGDVPYTLRTDPDGYALIQREATTVGMKDITPIKADGTTEPNLLVQALKRVEEKLDALAAAPPGGGLTEAQVRDIVREEIDGTKLAKA
jgi:hypothetical protein